MGRRPGSRNSTVERELDKAQAQFEAFDQQVKDLTLDRMNEAPKEDVEPQTKLSQKEIDKSKDIYLKPKKTIGTGVNPKTGVRELFNEKFRDEYNFAKEYVLFIAENHEIIGESIEIWTKPFPGMNAEFWEVPTNKPVWGPRYLAEQIKRCNYHRLKTEKDVITSADGRGTYTGSLVVDTTIQRLDARPATTRKSVFMSAGNF